MQTAGGAKIVFLTDDLGGGTGNHLLSLVRHWDRTEWNAEVLSGAPLTARVVPGLPVSYLAPPETFRRYPLRQIASMVRLRKEVRGRTPDIVHSFFFWSILYGRLLKWSGAVRRLVENREDQGFAWGPHEYAWLRWTGTLPDRVICVSEAVRRTVLEREKIDAARTRVIRNGLCPVAGDSDADASARKELGIGDGQPVVGMVANFNRAVKGVSYFIDAVPAILREVPTARFLLVGRGKEEASLRDQAKRLGVDAAVIFAGFRQDIGRFYRAMDLSVLTSLSEGLSITLLESMSFGLPVVATMVGGNPEVVIDGRTGYLVPARDPAAVVERIVRLLKDRTLRLRMGAEGKRRVEEDFRLQDVARRYLGVYQELLSQQ